jgi:hypothetical protein
MDRSTMCKRPCCGGGNCAAEWHGLVPGVRPRVGFFAGHDENPLCPYSKSCNDRGAEHGCTGKKAVSRLLQIIRGNDDTPRSHCLTVSELRESA